MKIYTGLIIDISTGDVEHEESFEYSGPLAECKGGGGEIKETSEEHALADVSMEQWNRFQTTLKPFEEEWRSNLTMDAGDHAKMAGQVNAGVGAEYDKEQHRVEGQQFKAGHDPSSGQFKGAVAGLSGDRGTDSSRAITTADQAVDDRTYQGLQQAINIGRGEAGDSMRDMTTLAHDATTSAVSKGLDKQRTKETWVSSGMSAAGMGLAGWKNRKPDLDDGYRTDEHEV